MSLFDHDLEDRLNARISAGSTPLAAARQYRGYSIALLASQSGVSADAIRAIEKGVARPDAFVRRLSQALNIPPNLIDGSDGHARGSRT